ncbi:MAG: hypothetical protein WCN92_05230, partial [Eubacteriales bacterium]
MTNNLNINYSIGAKTVLFDPDIEKMLAEMKAAGVNVLWLFCYFYGHFASTYEEMRLAKKVLEDHGFEVQAINVPLGHGGNAFDPSDDSVDLSIGDGWLNRVDINGSRQSCCACLTDKVVEDTRNVALSIRDLGITKIFYDDDLRLAHWGKNVQGCYCDNCIMQFNKIIGADFDRESLKEIIQKPEQTESDKATVEAWMDYNCDKITRYLKEVTVDGITSGIMVMHNGDRRHGIDIPKICAEIPGTLIRVGEGHFDNAAFEHEDAQASLTASISTHLALTGDTNRCYSESTVYPKFALTPENWIEKMRLEIKLGLRNIFLMGGTWYLAPEYWAALKDALPELNDLA